MSRLPIRVTLITDAWRPQVNGVTTILTAVVRLLRRWGDKVTIISPTRFHTIGCPTYPEIPLALARPSQIYALMEGSRPDVVHIATEGPLGLMARRYCLAEGVRFTTSYHTKFPEYISARTRLPFVFGHALMRRFHNAGNGCMVATASLQRELAARGFLNLMNWARGVDHALFRPRPQADLGLPRPVFITVARLAIEKNIGAFLRLHLPGSKVVVGDGPERVTLSRAHPDAHFLGVLRGEKLAAAYAAADAFVFPSRTDTFGNVLLEALSSGVPVAAFPVTGPQDVITDQRVGVLSEDLREAALGALELPRAAPREFALQFRWEASARAFRDNMTSVRF